jgi:hypothetical protein
MDDALLLYLFGDEEPLSHGKDLIKMVWDNIAVTGC